MKLIVGLGNFGPEYEQTRHNLGFIALDNFRENQGYSDWHREHKFKAQASEGQAGEEKLILAKPETFMNLSGQAVKLLADFYKIAPSDIWVLHDELDLPLGKLRISVGSGSAGHKGVESIIKSLGTKDFVRFRLGIAPEKKGFFSSLTKAFTSGKKLVLQKFSLDETKKIEEAKEATENALLTALKENLAKAQTEFNK